MSFNKTALALVALAMIMLVGCKEPIGQPNYDVRVATTQTESCYVTANIESGHLDWYKGVDRIWDSYSWSWASPITRAYDCYPEDPDRAYPRKNGYCIFTVPHFVGGGGNPATCVCTLYYFQIAHNGSASLLVTAWEETGAGWPPSSQQDRDDYFWAIWDGDVIATDSTHATDSCWYTIPLDSAACAAIAETAYAYPSGGGRFHTGWVYPDSVDGTYTDVTGYDLDHPPFIRVVYDDGE
jgi:hypothetical protein